MNKPQRRK